MTTWTDSAKDKLENYLMRLRSMLHASGADPAEVTEDMRRHISEEVTASRIEVVTTEDVDRILQRIGAPEAPAAFKPPMPQAPAPIQAPASLVNEPKRRHPFLFFFGVLLPLATLIIELITHMCAAAFFNPIPTFWHVLLVATVPVTNFLAWHAVRGRKTEWLKWLGIGNAFALGIAFYYTILYLPLAPIAAFAIIFFGWGLLPLSPLFSLAATWRLRFLLRRIAPPAEPRRVPGLWWGFGSVAAALAIITLPVPATRYLAEQAASGSPDQRTSALRWLRLLGSEKTLLSDCYGSTRWNDGVNFHMMGKPVPAEQARSLFYRVTGRAFNAVPPPQASYGSRTWDFMDEFSWDAEQGGTTVGGHLKGLSLAQSRLDGFMDADAAWSYVEWTLEFKNVSTIQREARAQIALPPGGVVSRLTLWVNGEEREAAFAGCSQVRQAYQQVVNVQRRDPVLVTSCGPDRVLMQCFPVPADGGTIKVRLGITSPLHLESAESAVALWPHFIERNFNVPDHLEHSVWVEARQPVQSASPDFKTDQSKPGVQALRAQLRDAALSAPSSTIRLRRDGAVKEAWVTDHRSTDGQIVRQTIKPRNESSPDRIVFVVDGSSGMTEFFPQIAEALSGLTNGTEFAVLLAGDRVEEISPVRKGDEAHCRQVTELLARTKGVGGQDNVPGLLRGWDLAAEKPGGVVVWIHGPQPQLLENSETFQQRFDWRPGAGPVINELQTTPGPDRVIEKLNGKAALKSVARFGNVREDLGRLIGGWRGDLKQLELVRERSAAGLVPVANRGKESSKHVVRLWAYDEVLRLIAAKKHDAAVQLAGLYQLVTPVSGAVVLETKQQFDQAGLQPVDPQSVPTVPEPGTIALLVLGLAMGALLRWRKKRSREPLMVGSQHR
jgi:hypothetical protein